MPDDTVAPQSIDSHPDFPVFFRRAQEDVFREFAPRLQAMYDSGNTAAAERLMAQLDQQARSRAVVATRAMLNFHAGQGGPGLDRPFVRSTEPPTLAGAESGPQAPPTTAPAPTQAQDSLPTTGQMLDSFVPAPRPTPSSLGPQGRSVADEVTYPGRLPSAMERVQALGAGMATAIPSILGLDASRVGEGVGMVDTLRGGQPHPVAIEGTDLGAMMAQDPAGASIGQMFGVGPAFRAAGGILASPPVQAGARALGRLLAQPGVGAGAGATAIGASTFAGAGEAQAPTSLPQTREPGAQKTLDEANAALTALNARRAAVQAQIDALDPEKIPVGTAQSPSDALRTLQRQYGLTDDGILGKDTRAALAQRRQQLQAQLQGMTDTTIRADITRAQAGLDEARRLDLLDQGGARLRQAQPGWLEQYGPLAGYPVGAALGHGLRWWLGRFGERTVAGEKTAADALASQFGQGSVPDRIGRLNQFWTQGGGAPAPFRFVPGSEPYPFQSITAQTTPGRFGRGTLDREVPNADQLYRPGLGTTLGPIGASLGVGGIETGVGQYMLSGAQRELADAQAAVSGSGPGKGPTEANIQRLTHAQRMVALWETTANMGRGAMGGAFTGELMHPLRGLPRPDVMAAEGERGALDMALRTPPPPRPTPPAPQPVWDASVQRWRLNGGFVSGGPPPRGQ